MCINIDKVLIPYSVSLRGIVGLDTNEVYLPTYIQ